RRQGCGRRQRRRPQRRGCAADVRALLARRSVTDRRRLRTGSCDRARFGRGAGRTHLGREPCERGRSPGVHVAGCADAIARRGRRRLMQAADERRDGRRGFLLLVGGGLSSLVWAGPVSRLRSPLTSAASQLVGNLVPVGGWRIYTISGTMPLFDPLSWRL